MRLTKNSPSIARLASLCLFAVLLLVGCSALANSSSVDDHVKTLIAAVPGQVANQPAPSSTHVVVSLLQMTQQGVSQPMLTMTAFNAEVFGTLEHKPTPTLGPSRIALD